MTKTTNYWIMKSEPHEFSIDDLKKKDVSIWDGIRNYQVRNMIRDVMGVGDRAFFYHSSSKEIGIVGEMEIIKSAYPDPTQFKANSRYFDKGSKKDAPRWLSVDVKFVAKFPRTLTLAEIKLNPKFESLPLVKKGNRLSIMPISKAHYDLIKKTV
ncbi:EVE domain-containing protein [Patescibacteria group bacterium]|nr:EVE domain-containing protein [Patescibacteria group bacterium]